MIDGREGGFMQGASPVPEPVVARAAVRAGRSRQTKSCSDFHLTPRNCSANSGIGIGIGIGAEGVAAEPSEARRQAINIELVLVAPHVADKHNYQLGKKKPVNQVVCGSYKTISWLDKDLGCGCHGLP